MGSEFALLFQALKTRWRDMNYIFFSYIISFSLCHYHHHHLWVWLFLFFSKGMEVSENINRLCKILSDRNLDSGPQRQTGGKIERNKRKTLRKNERERKECERENEKKTQRGRPKRKTRARSAPASRGAGEPGRTSGDAASSSEFPSLREVGATLPGLVMTSN